MVTRCLLREAAPAPLLRWCALSKNATSHHSHTESGSISLHALSAPAWRGVRELLETLEAPGCRVGWFLLGEAARGTQAVEDDRRCHDTGVAGDLSQGQAVRLSSPALRAPEPPTEILAGGGVREVLRSHPQENAPAVKIEKQQPFHDQHACRHNHGSRARGILCRKLGKAPEEESDPVEGNLPVCRTTCRSPARDCRR